MKSLHYFNILKVRISHLFKRNKEKSTLISPNSTDEELFSALQQAVKEEQKIAFRQETPGGHLTWHADVSVRYIEQCFLVKSQKKTNRMNFFYNFSLILLTAILAWTGIISYRQSIRIYEATNRPYVNLDSISFDERSEVNLKLSNNGLTSARNAFFVFAKFAKDDPDFGEEVFDYTPTSLPSLSLDVGVKTGVDGSSGHKTAKMIVPITIGDLSPKTSRSIKLQLNRPEEISWIQEGNLVSLLLLYKDHSGKKLKYYYVISYDRSKKIFSIISESEKGSFPLEFENVRYYFDKTIK